MSAAVRDDIVIRVRAGLIAVADPEAAPAMQAYMKSSMPYYGVKMPVVRRTAKAVYDAHRIETRSEWDATIRAMYDDASHREERYAALSLAAHRYYRDYATDVAALPLYEHLIRTGAWWDLVDETSHRVGDVLRAHRAAVAPLMQAWTKDRDMWVRRSSVICQVGHKTDTDLALLAFVVEANQGDREFFIRKAIGWALRDVAYAHPEWVLAFVEGHPDLSALSRREALKRLGAAGG